jgi:hypothetical protein
MHTSTCRFKLAALAAAAALVSGLPAPPAAADDRSLVKASESEPYVMILLDVTGSMNRVPEREAYPALRQDDPASRMYQAKEAIYELLDSPNTRGIHFGFATFPNRDYLRARNKLCDPFDGGSDNGNCISGNEGRDVCGQAGNPTPNCGIHTESTCRGWEPNGDANDGYLGKNFNQLTRTNPNDPGYPAAMRYGDVIPMDWQSENDRLAGELSDNRQRIRERMAPNVKDDPDAVPNFGVSSYFHNTTSDGSLDFVDPSQRPIIAHGFTPLSGALDDFGGHFATWKTVARANDPEFGCKQVHVILITDGLQTAACPGDPATAAEAIYLNGDGPQVWVIGYSTGVGSDGKEALNEIAESGGTFSCPIVNQCTPGEEGCCDGEDVDHAFFPISKEDLIAAIGVIANEIRADARSFAAAAVPQGQANVSDKIFLASFFPLPDSPLWPGALDAYLRPLPLRPITVELPDGETEERLVPDRGVECTADSVSRCRLWDAGEELLEQAPTDGQVLARQYNLGLGADQRRVFYSVEDDTPGTVPAVRKPFIPDTLASDDAAELMQLMACSSAFFPSCDPGDTDAVDKLHRVVSWVHKEKEYVVPSPDPDPSDDFDPGESKPYLLGEIFHSDPAVIGSPENFRYYVDDLFSDGRPTKALLSQGYDAACGNQGEGENPGYVCFFERHRYRRKLVIAGSNDGQLHAFDGGIFEGELNDETGIVTGEFNNGTGREIFSFIPRNLMPMLSQQAHGVIELYGVDGRAQAADVFIDAGAGREWRTVVLGSLREGGVGYFALDVTQPDQLSNLDDDDPVPVPTSGSYVPSCINGGADCAGEYPKVLWEFYDRCVVEGEEQACDQDLPTANGHPDLAEGWSRPVIGVVDVCANSSSPCTSVERKFVAAFGGGFDPDEPEAGNFIFIVDIETGKPIYKRAVTGAVPSELAAVDTDQNGLLDTIYVGTTAGLMYKVSLQGVPPLTAGRVAPGNWDPFPIFNVNTAGEPVRPIFYPPSVIFVTERGRYALAFGTGYREDLWESAEQTARFVVILDEFRDTSGPTPVVRPFENGDYLAGDLPLNVGDIGAAISTESETVSNANLLQTGWWMELQEEERLIASPFALSGLLVFLTFQPEQVIAGDGSLCANTGVGRSFTVQTVNGSTLRSGRKPYTIIPDLPTSPFTEVGVTKNPDPQSEEETETIPDEMLSVMEALKRLFPRECRFGNYSINVKSRRSDTGIEWIAPVPICIVQKNWKGL